MSATNTITSVNANVDVNVAAIPLATTHDENTSPYKHMDDGN